MSILFILTSIIYIGMVYSKKTQHLPYFPVNWIVLVDIINLELKIKQTSCISVKLINNT